MIDLFQIRKIKSELVEVENKLIEAESLILTLRSEISALKEVLDMRTSKEPLLYTVHFYKNYDSVDIVADSCEDSYYSSKFFLKNRLIAELSRVRGFVTKEIENNGIS